MGGRGGLTGGGFPLLGSVITHILIIGAVFLLTWNLARDQETETTPVVTAKIPDTSAMPIPRLEATETKEDVVVEELNPLEFSFADTLGGAGALALTGGSGGMPGIGRGTAMTLGRVEFAGLGAGAARRIVFVVDASGSMIGVFPFVIDELARSLEQLSPAQSYSVIFFQRDEALLAPPQGRLNTATMQHVEQTMQWIRGRPGRPPTVVPTGRSNPLEALRQALALQPEVVFLLSSNVTGSGRYAVDLDDLMASLDQLNPIDPETGERAVHINCIQFLDPDPRDALRTIVEEHGSPDSYRFLSRSELGLNPLER